MEQQRQDLDVEAALREDKSGEYRKLLMTELMREATTIRNELNRGVSAGEYKQLDALLKATESASEVVDKVWQQIHAH